MLIVYSARCLACANKPLWKHLNTYALQNKLKFEVRRVDLNRHYREEAAQYGFSYPFVVKDGIAMGIEQL